MATPNFDFEDMENALNVISEAAEDHQIRAELEQHLLSELVVNHTEHLVELLESLPNIKFVIDSSENTINHVQLVASHNGVKIIVTIFECEDLASIDISRESGSKSEKVVNPQHEWFYGLWETLCFISDDKKLEHLSDAEGAVFHIGLLEAEVMNGGIGQYLTNTDGAYIDKTVEYLETIGAKKTSQILNDAMKLNWRNEPFINIWITKKEQLEELDNKFLSSKEDLAGLVAESYLDDS